MDSEGQPDPFEPKNWAQNQVETPQNGSVLAPLDQIGQKSRDWNITEVSRNGNPSRQKESNILVSWIDFYAQKRSFLNLALLLFPVISYLQEIFILVWHPIHVIKSYILATVMNQASTPASCTY